AVAEKGEWPPATESLDRAVRQGSNEANRNRRPPETRTVTGAPMKRLGLVCCLWLLAAPPAGAADYAAGDWFIISGKSKLSTSIPGHPLLKDSAQWVKDG